MERKQAMQQLFQPRDCSQMVLLNKLNIYLEQQRKHFEHLIVSDYRLMFVEPVDMLPGTKNLEYITLFCLKNDTQS